MLKYIARRLILLPLLLLGISVVVFLLFQLTPRDPISARFGLRMSSMSTETIKQLRQDLGFNDPLPVQYGRYVANLLRGDLGTSINTRKPVLDEIASRIPATLELAVSAMIIIIALSIPLGVISALNLGKLIDRVLMGGALLGFSMPSFWLGIISSCSLPSTCTGYPPPGAAAACSLNASSTSFFRRSRWQSAWSASIPASPVPPRLKFWDRTTSPPLILKG